MLRSVFSDAGFMYCTTMSGPANIMLVGAFSIIWVTRWTSIFRSLSAVTSSKTTT